VDLEHWPTALRSGPAGKIRDQFILRRPYCPSSHTALALSADRLGRDLGASLRPADPEPKTDFKRGPPERFPHARPTPGRVPPAGKEGLPRAGARGLYSPFVVVFNIVWGVVTSLFIRWAKIGPFIIDHLALIIKEAKSKSILD